jgi:prolyl-tRNA synthetase
MSNKLTDITADFAQWYQDVIYAAELVDESPVRGCYVIRPYGWAMWEHIQTYMDARIKQTGHQNASFPLLIPESFIHREAEHVEGFSPQLAVVTYAGGKELEEKLVVRPTSETTIHHSFARWIKSWRDLPLKVNQWANVVRWELRPRPFLRTSEFFWQEGHTAHETLQEAQEEVLLMLNEYMEFIQGQLLIPVIVGQKSESEKFAGAERTYALEALMPDGRALQMCTSHLLSQNFAKAFHITFQDRQKELSYPYLTSWGLTTRLIGAVIMTHGDQKGLILPPAIAPYQIVVVPIYKTAEEKAAVTQHYDFLKTALSAWRVFFDEDEQQTPGAKFYHWELRGVPLRLEIGMRDAQAQQVVMVNRLNGNKQNVRFAQLTEEVDTALQLFANDLYVRAQQRQESLLFTGTSLVEFGPLMQEQGGGFITGWCQNPACEQELKKYSGFTRCLLETHRVSQCFHCGKESVQDVLVAKSY